MLYGFETYEPDAGKVPRIIESEQRIRETGNAFIDFAVQVVKAPTVYTDAFAGKRPRASSPEMNNWLKRDDTLGGESAGSYDESLEFFRQAYINNSLTRRKEEDRLPRIVPNRMDRQDRAFLGLTNPLIMQFDEEDSTDQEQDDDDVERA